MSDYFKGATTKEVQQFFLLEQMSAALVKSSKA